jgi:hypothetical protein
MLELLADARPRGSQLGFGILSRMLPAAPLSSGLLSSPPRLRPEHAEHWQLGKPYFLFLLAKMEFILFYFLSEIIFSAWARSAGKEERGVGSLGAELRG